MQAYKGDVFIPVYGSIAGADVYLKKDADKVIRRLKAKLARKGISNQRLEADKNHNWRKYCRALAECRDAQARLFRKFAAEVILRQLHGFQPAVTVGAVDRRADRCQLASKLWGNKSRGIIWLKNYINLKGKVFGIPYCPVVYWRRINDLPRRRRNA